MADNVGDASINPPKPKKGEIVTVIYSKVPLQGYDGRNALKSSVYVDDSKQEAKDRSNADQSALNALKSSVHVGDQKQEAKDRSNADQSALKSSVYVESGNETFKKSQKEQKSGKDEQRKKSQKERKSGKDEQRKKSQKEQKSGKDKQRKKSQKEQKSGKDEQRKTSQKEQKETKQTVTRPHDAESGSSIPLYIAVIGAVIGIILYLLLAGGQ